MSMCTHIQQCFRNFFNLAHQPRTLDSKLKSRNTTLINKQYGAKKIEMVKPSENSTKDSPNPKLTQNNIEKIEKTKAIHFNKAATEKSSKNHQTKRKQTGFVKRTEILSDKESSSDDNDQDVIRKTWTNKDANVYSAYLTEGSRNRSSLQYVVFIPTKKTKKPSAPKLKPDTKPTAPQDSEKPKKPNFADKSQLQSMSSKDSLTPESSSTESSKSEVSKKPEPEKRRRETEESVDSTPPKGCCGKKSKPNKSKKPADDFQDNSSGDPSASFMYLDATSEKFQASKKTKK